MAHGLKNKRVLPDNFASTVLDLELEIETGKFSAESVNRLTSLYMEAVEYYAAYESDKYTYFQDKLTKLLSNQKVYEHLENSPTKDKKPPEISHQTEVQAPAKPTTFNHRKQMELNMIMGEKKAQDMTKELLQNYGSSRRELNKLVQENLKSQETDIAKRLEQRKQLARSNSQRNIAVRNNLGSSLTLDSEATLGSLNVPGVDFKDLRPSTPRGTGSDDPYGFGQLTSQSNKVKLSTDGGEPDGLEASKAALLESAATLEPLMKPVTASVSTGGKKKASFLDKLKRSAKPLDDSTPADAESPGIKPFVPEQTQSSDQKIQLVVTPAGGDSAAQGSQVDSLNTSPTMPKSPSPFKTTGTKKKKAKIVIELDTQEEIDALKQELEVLESQFAEETDEARQSELEEEILKINIEIDNKMQEATMKAEQALKAAEEGLNPPTSDFDTELDLAEQEQALLAAETEQTADTNSTPNEAPKKKGGALGAMMNRLKGKSKQAD